jgi:hypothetical protein
VIWPAAAPVAVYFIVNFEEQSDISSLGGDAESEWDVTPLPFTHRQFQRGS